MKKIYVLTEGDYSDYHIVGVYSTPELAQEAQTLYPEEDDELEVMRFGCRVSFFKTHVNANSKMCDTITKCKCCHSCSNHNSITKTFCP